MTPSAATALALAALATAAPAFAGDPGAARVRDGARAFRAAQEVAIVREFAELLAIPNVASDAPNIRRNADHIVTMLQQRGFEARLLDGAGGPPAVYGHLRTPGATRTIVVYAHYDGQPVDPARWTSPPWTPTLRAGPAADAPVVPLDGLRAPIDPEWRLYARSAGDDKAPVIALLAAIDALRAASLAPSVDLKVFLDGEEEAGSPHARAVLEQNRELLKADAWLFCDGPVHQSREWQVFFGARGITGLDLTVYGPARALHSGHYGNWAPNPAAALARLIASMRDDEGRSLVAGLEDGVRPVSESERRAVAEAPDVEAGLREALALGRTEGSGLRLGETLLRPAINVRGLEAGRVGAAAANAIMTEARASLDFRLVPDQRPEQVREAVEAHLRARGWHVVTEAPDAATLRHHPRVVRAEWETGYPAFRTPMDLPVSEAVGRVLDEARGRPVVRVPTLGGSVPMATFHDVLGVPIVGVPVANHDNNQHAADENLRLGNLWDAIEIYAALVARLGHAWPADGP